MTGRRRAFAAAAVLLVVGLGAGGYFGLRQALERPFAEPASPVTVEIPRGIASRDLAALLEREGAIPSARLFLVARALRRDAVLQAGEYLFEGPRSTWDVFETIAAGRVRLHPLTVPEGLTRFEVAALVERAGFASAEEFLALTGDPAPVADLFPQARDLEGCLFPETYRFPRSAGAREVLAAMLGTFRREFAAASKGRSGGLKPHELLTLASLIEKETGVAAERRLVSSVYHNRIGRGMLLQCDPTIIYGLILEDRYRGAIHKSEILDPHPYNTYVHPGLPPGPIASPGRASLRAAFDPADSDYLYFVAEAEGRSNHVFSRDLAAHNRAVAQYRRTTGRGKR